MTQCNGSIYLLWAGKKRPPPLLFANTVVNSHANPVGPPSSHPSIPSTTICLTITIYHWPISKVIKNKIETSELLSGLRHIIVLHPYMSILFSLIQFCPTWISKIYIIAFMFLKQWRKFHCFFSDDINHINGWTIILAWWVIYPISWGQTLLRTEGQCHNKVMETVMIRAITSK